MYRPYIYTKSGNNRRSMLQGYGHKGGKAGYGIERLTPVPPRTWVELCNECPVLNEARVEERGYLLYFVASTA